MGLPFFDAAVILASEAAKQTTPVEDTNTRADSNQRADSKQRADSNQRGYKGTSRAMEDRRRQRSAAGGANASQAPSSAQTASTNAEVARATKRNTLYGE